MSTHRHSGPWEYDATCGEIRPVGVPSTSVQVASPDYVQGSCVLVAESIGWREDGYVMAAAPELRDALEIALIPIDGLARGIAISPESADEIAAVIRKALAKARVPS